MAGRSEFSVLDLRRKSGHVDVALSWSSATLRCPLSIASRSTDDALVDAAEDAGDAACTAFMVTSRAETHIFLSERCAALIEALAVEVSTLLPEAPADVAASGELRSRLWKAAPAVAAGRLLPHCSHALLIFVRFCFLCVTFFVSRKPYLRYIRATYQYQKKEIFLKF